MYLKWLIKQNSLNPFSSHLGIFFSFLSTFAFLPLSFDVDGWLVVGVSKLGGVGSSFALSINVDLSGGLDDVSRRL